jgi:protein SCO1/2
MKLRRATLSSLCLVLTIGIATVVAAHAIAPPADLNQRVGYDQHIGRSMPGDIPMLIATGRAATFASLAGGKPLVLAFGYYRCPNLCDLTLHGMAKAVAATHLQAGTDYHVAFISIDPAETPHDAQAAQAMLRSMEPRARVDAWTFATAPPQSIARLTGAAGFRYMYDARNRQFAHPAGLVVLTGEGTIAQYFFGVSHDARSLDLALIDASRSRLGSVIDQLVLFCCGYDPATGRYSLLISRLMMVLGCGFVAAMALLWLRMRRRSA